MTDTLLGMLIGLGAGLLLGWVWLLIWKARYTRSIRQDAVSRSQAVTAGKVYEQLTPLLPGFPFDPKDVRFLGSPVDLVVFDGLARGQLERVVLVEVKTGGATLSTRERQVRDAVRSRRVEWVEWRGP